MPVVDPDTRMRLLHVGCVVASTCLAVGCSSSSPDTNDDSEANDPASSDVVRPADKGGVAASPWFVDETRQRGLDFTYHSDATEACRMPEIMGGGAALFDKDNDGDLDLYLVQGGTLGASTSVHNQLFENDGTGHFTDVTATSNAKSTGYGMGVAAGDVDNDGDVDLYITNLGPNQLLINDGTGRFTIAPSDTVRDAGWGTSAAFADMDNDGDLDLYVCNYLNWSPEVALECFNTMGGIDYCSPRNYMAPAVDRLYRNEGDGTFTDVTESAGINSVPGTGLGIVATDANLDGWSDFFVANDGMPDALWINQHDGTFLERATELGCALDRDGRASAGMGVAAGDLDRDGDDDILVCNLRNESDSLFLNEGGSYFVNATARFGIAAASRRYTRFGQCLIDFDHDGYLDLFQANGRVMRQQGEVFGSDPYAEPNLLLRGSATRFDVVPEFVGGDADVPATSRGAAYGDVDGDGAVDLVVVNRDAPTQLLLNRVPDRGGWLMFDLRTTTGRAAIGARIEVYSDEACLATGIIRRASSYLSSNDARWHVGLGQATGPLSVRVQWVGTTVVESFSVAELNQQIVLRQGAGDQVQPIE